MSTETPDTGGADKEQPVDQASNKRKRESTGASEENVERMYCFRGIDILQCSICSKPFCPWSAVYQCEKGHIACLACKGGGSRSIRSIAIETILKSLEVSCKYAQYGCKQMLGSLYIIRAHESYCKYKPFPCPVPECIFKGSRETLPKHLTVEHHVRTVAYNGISAAGFTMEPSDRIVMVTVDKRAGGGDMHLVHREVHQVLGEVFFCTTFHGELWDCKLTYNLKVQFKSTSSRPTLSLKSAPTRNLRDKEYWEKDFLLLPVKSMLPAEQVEVHFKVIPG